MTDQEPDEPHEPFLPDEMLEPSYTPEAPELKNLHLPKSPITKERLKAFLIEFKPLVDHIQEMSRKDQHLLDSHLQQIKNQLHSSDLGDEISHLFEKVAMHFSNLLRHSAPIDQDAVIKDIDKLESKL